MAVFFRLLRSTIGLCAILAASACGCDPIIVVDINDDKLSLASRCGATHTINGLEDPVNAVRELTADNGSDFGVESAGLSSSITMDGRFECGSPPGTSWTR